MLTHREGLKRQRTGASEKESAQSQLRAAAQALQQVLGGKAQSNAEEQGLEEGSDAEGRLSAIKVLLKQILESHSQIDSQQGSGTSQGTIQREQVFSRNLTVLQKDAEELQALLDKHSLPDVPDYCKVAPTVANAKRIATYAHKLSYTTFAPPVVLGQNLFRPPAPQEWDFRASVLHQLAGSQQEVPPAVPQAVQGQTAEGHTAALPEPQVRVPARPAPLEEEEQQAGPDGETAPEPPKQFQPVTRSAFDFILNPDLEAVEEEYSSSEDEDSEGD